MTAHFRNTTARLHEAADAAMNALTGPGEDMTLYPVLAELEDHDTIPGEFVLPLESDGLMTMVNALELIVALESASIEFGFNNSHAAVLEKAEHESQHAMAINALGMRAVHAMRFKQLSSGDLGMKVTTLAVGGPITKLGFASTLAYPARLSNSDLRKLQTIGYSDPNDVSKRIEKSDGNIPMPLSVIGIQR